MPSMEHCSAIQVVPVFIYSLKNKQIYGIYIFSVFINMCMQPVNMGCIALFIIYCLFQLLFTNSCIYVQGFVESFNKLIVCGFYLRDMWITAAAESVHT